jgi:hypothetical protein
MKCAQTFEIGVYVLGALAPAERAAFERHMAECAVCREEVAELAVLPGLLGRLDLATAAAVARDGEEYGLTDEAADEGQRWAGPTAVPERTDAQAGTTPAETRPGESRPRESRPGETRPGESRPRETRPAEAKAKAKWAGPTAEVAEGREGGVDDSNVVSLLDAARRRRASERRRRRMWSVVAGVAAACLAVLVGLGAIRLFGQVNEGEPDLTAMTPVASSVPITAEVGLVPVVEGSRVTMHCQYQGRGGERWAFNLVVVPRSGAAPEEVANWTAGYGDDIQMSATTHYRPDEIARIDLRRNDGTPVLRYTL